MQHDFRITVEAVNLAHKFADSVKNAVVVHRKLKCRARYLKDFPTSTGATMSWLIMSFGRYWTEDVAVRLKFSSGGPIYIYFC